MIRPTAFKFDIIPMGSGSTPEEAWDNFLSHEVHQCGQPFAEPIEWECNECGETYDTPIPACDTCCTEEVNDV